MWSIFLNYIYLDNKIYGYEVVFEKKLNVGLGMGKFLILRDSKGSSFIGQTLKVQGKLSKNRLRN